MAPAPVVDDPERYFDARVVPVDLGAVEREEREREDWLASAEAVKQREASWRAYGDLSPAESEELLRTVFAEQLQALNDDPARFLSDAQLIRPLDETAAAVKDEGEKSLLDTSIPVRTESESGNLAKVDLSLTKTPLGYETENAVSDLHLPLAADEKAHVGGDGFAISQAEAKDSAARRFGDKNLLYPEVLPDTDLMVAPTAAGVELFNVLRSKESPEELRFDIDIPEGGVLKADGYGGAEVVRDEKTLTHISPPMATDAQGTYVPVELKVEQSAIVLHVPHRSGDFAAPILVDPIIEDWANTGANWYEGKNLAALTNGAWKYEDENSGIYENVCCWGGTKTGLMVSFTGNFFFGPHQDGQWSYSTANAKTYIQHAWVTPFWRHDESCTSAQPHDYAGMLWEPGEIWNPVVANAAKNAATLSTSGNGHAFIIGMGSGPPGVFIPCYRHLYAGGVALWIDDDWPPVIHSFSGPPSGWFGDKGKSTLTVDAGDEGLGVYEVKLTPDESAKLEAPVGCTGLYGNRCPNEKVSKIEASGNSFKQGIRSVGVVVSDPSGKVAEQFFTTKVDNSVPEVTLSGELAEATKEVGEFSEQEDPAGWDKLRLPVYQLNIKAIDGSRENDKTKRSGVKDIKIFLDDEPEPMDVPWEPLDECPLTSCEMDVTYPLVLTEIETAGKHELKVEVEDFVGEIRERNIEFEYFPATGMKDEYVMHYFPLPNGQGNEEAEEHPVRPELAVNVMNGNLVYREQDVDVEGTAQVDLEVERYYNSQLPDSENTEWGDGWTLAQTPDLEPVNTGGSPAPDEAELLDQSGALEEEVELPAEAGAEKFDPALQATLTKREGGGFELTDETGQSATSVVFDETGQTEARVTEGYAKLDYRYEGGDLAEIEVEDPSTFAADPEELEIPEPPPFTAPSFAYAFGAYGEGEGEFEAPADVAVGPEGDIWVVDVENERIQHFSRFGKYLDEFGTEGYGDGQLRSPVAIEIDEDGNLWVLDSHNDRVRKFNPQGEFLAKWGKYGTEAGKLNTPWGMAIDAQGNVWVSDTYNDRLQKFSPNGTLLAVAGTSGEGELAEPLGIDIGPGGEVFVADWANNRVVAFDSEGNYQRDFGSEGYGEGQFHGPLSVEVDTRGSVWVLDGSDEELEQFDTDGEFIAKYGEEGTGDAEFEFTEPAGITTDARGGIWIVDSGNYRLQRWTRGAYRPSYDTTVGSTGTANGQFDLPSDLDIDSQGDIWVVDNLNNRVQQLDSEGKFISKFGALGSANGQLKRPTAIEIDAQDNIWVADAGNDRLQKFNQAGQYLATLSSSGTTPGKIDSPEGIAIDAEGDIWVADTRNDRVQEFSPAGVFLQAVGVEGEGALSEPQGLDVLFGEVFVADWLHQRIAVFDESGEYLREFGAEGYGLGEFSYPNALEIDDNGNVWVGGHSNERFHQFNLEGEFITDFGSQGTGEGEFELTTPSGIATDSEGGIWVTDSGNDRLQRWENPGYVAAPEPELTDGDAEVQVETPGGLVSSVSGNAAGEHGYAHEGDLLVAHDGPEGEVAYDYDEEDRLIKVTLPNGTWAEIDYEADYGRVEEVRVSVEGGEAKTTHFLYKDDAPRRTTVTPSDAPHIVYDIGEDGSVFKWWNTAEAPILDLGGTIYDQKNEPGGLWPGAHLLTVEAIDVEGIESIQVIVNGTDLVSEKICEREDLKTEAIECEKEEDQWVTETELHAQGHLNVEVIATDQAGESSSERFWVDIPAPPPTPALGTPIPPKFNDILKFREEYGLEVVFPVANEDELYGRIFNLIKAWDEPNTPAGQVARSSMDRWGVPLRPVDVAEMEYREAYVEQAASVIPQWAEVNALSSYAGHYVDHRAGGVVHVGFTQNQSALVNLLKAQAGLIAADRTQQFLYQPARSLNVLHAQQGLLADAARSPGAPPSVFAIDLDIKNNEIDMGTAEVAQVTGFIENVLGLGAGVDAVYQAAAADEFSGRYNARLPFLGGMELHTDEAACTAGFGAWSKKSTKPSGGPLRQRYALTAGHCYKGSMENSGSVIYRSRSWHEYNKEFPNGVAIGRVKRRGYTGDPGSVDTDALAIALESPDMVPGWVYECCGGRAAMRPRPPVFPSIGQILCQSSRKLDKVACGPVTKTDVLERFKDPKNGQLSGWHWMVRLNAGGEPGDSGAPVWVRNSGNAVGLVAGGGPEGLVVTPFIRSPAAPPNHSAGILSDHYLSPNNAPLHLQIGR